MRTCWASTVVHARGLASGQDGQGGHRLPWRAQPLDLGVGALRSEDHVLRGVLELRADDLVSGGSGVRAQALEPDGKLTDDFRFVEGPRSLHVLCAPSPAATASIAIGEEIAKRAAQHFGWNVAVTS